MTIAPFTKRLGFAVFDGEEIIYFAVKTLKPPRLLSSVGQEISQSIGRLNDEFEPKLIVVKTLSSRQDTSKILRLVAEQIKREAESRKLPIEEFSLERVKQELCSDEKTTKANLFKKLSDVYPEIKRFTVYQNRSQAEYYNSVLSAVAIGYYRQKKTIEA